MSNEASSLKEEPEPISISALQHWQYCPRQCGLIHLEQVFAENIHTQRGQAVHSTVDTPGFETRHGIKVERALPIWSDKLGLIGKADIVEYLSDGTPYPVEYKHGSKRKSPRIAQCDDIQLAAQALCLEEMTGHTITEGAIFYASSKRRRTVVINERLRQLVIDVSQAIRVMLSSQHLPKPSYDERCKECSLFDLCQPASSSNSNSKGKLLATLFDPES
jgi:CRISPR-associated exonuclease Cas4